MLEKKKNNRFCVLMFRNPEIRHFSEMGKGSFFLFFNSPLSAKYPILGIPFCILEASDDSELCFPGYNGNRFPYKEGLKSLIKGSLFLFDKCAIYDIFASRTAKLDLP